METKDFVLGYGAGKNSAVSEKIVEEVDAWLDEHITNPDSPPLDRSLTSSSAAAPADMVGDIDDEVGDLKNTLNAELINANALDVYALIRKFDFEMRGVTYTWNNDKTKCTINGTATGGNSVLSYGTESTLPTGLKAGSTYRLLYSSENVFFSVLVYSNGALISELVKTKTNAIFTLPANTTGVIVRFFVASGTFVNNEIVTAPIILTEVPTNKEIQNILQLYNCYNIISDTIIKTNSTSGGFTFTWNGDVCTVTGSATNYGIYVLLNTAFLPPEVVPGEIYFVKYKTTDTRVRLRIRWKTSSGSDVRSDYFESNAIITVPSTAEKWIIELFIGNTVTLENPVTVSEIALCNAPTNKDAFENAFITRGIIPSGTDINTIRTSGYYLLNSGYTYTNAPFSSDIAGILLVYPVTTNSIEQIAYSLGSPAATKLYARSAILGVFYDWKEIGGEQIVNEYISEHYDNTYNITCSPTITTDTNNYLASTGDYTDRTGDIQTMLNSTGICRLGPGRFVVTGVDVPDYSALIGSGNRTVLILADSVTTGYAVKLNNQTTVTNLRINGGTTAQGSSSTVGTRHGILFEGTKVSGQTGGVTKKKSIIDKCIINNFSGGGITLTGTGVDLDSNLVISNCFVDHCGAGLNIPYYSEFHRVTNCAFTYNYYGCVDNGGNNNFANCDFSGNKVGILIDNSTNQSPNNSHGTFSGCSVNHSYSDAGVINEGTAIKLLKANLGEMFTGMQIFYGAIVIDDCVGIRFVGANIGSKVPITITDSTVVTFSDCMFREGPTHADSTFTQSNNTVLKFTDCYLRDGTVYNPMA